MLINRTVPSSSAKRRTTTVLALMLVAVSAGLAGCQTPPPAPAPTEDPVVTRLKLSLAKVDKHPEYTRSADEAERPPQPAVKEETVTVSFQGDAAQLLQKVATARGLRFSVHGPRPFLPLPVHVDVVGVSFEEFLTDVGHQFGQRADLVLGEGALEIRYRGAK